MPAAPARAEPRPNVKEITTSVLTPIRRGGERIEGQGTHGHAESRVQDDRPKADEQEQCDTDDDELADRYRQGWKMRPKTRESRWRDQK